jgi:tetratricopeptide (TPR) repeat protein
MSAEAIFGIVATLVAGVWVLYRYFSEKTGEAAEVDVNAIVATLQEGHRNQLHDAAQREETLRDQVGQLTEAVQALSIERDKPDAPAGIDEALALLSKGETGAAEAVFQEVKEHRKAEEAAAAARHIGALAFLHDTEKALAAYHEAVDLDSDNADGWNRLGHLLYRTGDIDDAEQAFMRVLALGNRVENQELIAIATGNLGLLYSTRGDLDRAEEMYKKSLAIEEALGRKEGMASDYGNLGNLYLTRGDLDRAEEMYGKSLALNEALGSKEGMANQYGNLGNLYSTRGELDRAEEMYKQSLTLNEALRRKEGMALNYSNLGVLYKTRGDLDHAEELYEKSLALFREVGAAPMIEQVEESLANLRRPD